MRKEAFTLRLILLLWLVNMVSRGKKKEDSTCVRWILKCRRMVPEYMSAPQDIFPSTRSLKVGAHHDRQSAWKLSASFFLDTCFATGLSCTSPPHLILPGESLLAESGMSPHFEFIAKLNVGWVCREPHAALFWSYRHYLSPVVDEQNIAGSDPLHPVFNEHTYTRACPQKRIACSGDDGKEIPLEDKGRKRIQATVASALA